MFSFPVSPLGLQSETIGFLEQPSNTEFLQVAILKSALLRGMLIISSLVSDKYQKG
jgi:hypothetical protein